MWLHGLSWGALRQKSPGLVSSTTSFRVFTFSLAHLLTAIVSSQQVLKLLVFLPCLAITFFTDQVACCHFKKYFRRRYLSMTSPSFNLNYIQVSNVTTNDAFVLRLNEAKVDPLRSSPHEPIHAEKRPECSLSTDGTYLPTIEDRRLARL